MVFSFLYKFQEILIEYFKELEEESIRYQQSTSSQLVRDNFVIIYELLDEMMDNGYPQITEVISLFLILQTQTKTLQEYIKSDSHKLDGERSTSKSASSIDVAIPDTINSVPWRPPNIKHKKNEVFLDVIEKLNMLVKSYKTF
jgi:AP-1 complex subunit mu